eukprot:CAMPEP_0117031220 /NCGR_PEP_ID=MMETSP0472-20121206/22468_1 /TAXON_ID=693140 ORGANISM="Tiarina fusus, Strain LIS" /NCGR_SAMPLE_ID=MMETSP0472 /ASSEMBLY_ACC=CAM_ASM_000603 /LENGTH=285 /DNA_ID=CAMNT_0004739507 /DNA_START=99 /DNA_END=953 /DNA_ORIENTATION=+
MAASYLSEEDLEYASRFNLDEDNMVDSFINDFSDVFDSSAAVQQSARAKGMEVLEPTPIAPQGVVVVDKLPFGVTPWHCESNLLQSLKSVLKNQTEESFLNRGHQEPSRRSASFCGSSNAYNQANRYHATTSRQMARRWSEGTTPIGVASTMEQQLQNDCEASSGSEASSSFRSSHVEQWNQRYRELQRFQKEHDHCLVPLNWPKNPSLAHWVKRQRYLYRVKQEGKHSTLTEERQQALAALGFVWDSHAAGWEERWNELREFKERHGHCNVPKKFPENQQLAVW